MHTDKEHATAKANGFTCKTAKNDCCCFHKGDYMIARQLKSTEDNPLYNAYKANYKTETSPLGKKMDFMVGYSSVIKEVIRVDKSLNKWGEEQSENVLGAKEYSTLEAAMADCK